jgi:hypothetical protein
VPNKAICCTQLLVRGRVPDPSPWASPQRTLFLLGMLIDPGGVLWAWGMPMSLLLQRREDGYQTWDAAGARGPGPKYLVVHIMRMNPTMD